jgi:hypothetical protein
VDSFVSYRYGFYEMVNINMEALHAVFTTCGVTDKAMRTLIFNHEGFTQLADLGVLEMDRDVMEMSKKMANRTKAEGRVILGTVVISSGPASNAYLVAG